MDYKISVVIRTYNEEKHIGEVLKSLNKQTYSNFEVIILDSQSTDNTIKIAQNYDVRIEQIEKKESTEEDYNTQIATEQENERYDKQLHEYRVQKINEQMALYQQIVDDGTLKAALWQTPRHRSCHLH